MSLSATKPSAKAPRTMIARYNAPPVRAYACGEFSTVRFAMTGILRGKRRGGIIILAGPHKGCPENLVILGGGRRPGHGYGRLLLQRGGRDASFGDPQSVGLGGAHRPVRRGPTKSAPLITLYGEQWTN